MKGEPLIPVKSRRVIRIVRYMLEDLLDCGHMVRQNVGGKVPERPPKRRRCWTCANAAREASAIFEARCDTCGQERSGRRYPRVGDDVRLSTRLRSKAEAQRDVDEHLAEHPGHKATVFVVGR
jgi:hypothetical protein